MEKPYIRENTIASQQFHTFESWYKNKSDEELVAIRDELVEKAKDFCRYSWKQMMDMDYQARCILYILYQRGSNVKG